MGDREPQSPKRKVGAVARARAKYKNQLICSSCGHNTHRVLFLLVILERLKIATGSTKKSRRFYPAGRVELEENKRASGLFYPVICSSIPSLNQNGLEAHYLIYRKILPCDKKILKSIFQCGMFRIRTTWMQPSPASTFAVGLRVQRPSFPCPDRGPSALRCGNGVQTCYSRVPAQEPH